jgi:hypothetical protein
MEPPLGGGTATLTRPASASRHRSQSQAGSQGNSSVRVSPYWASRWRAYRRPCQGALGPGPQPGQRSVMVTQFRWHHHGVFRNPEPDPEL